MNQFKLISGFNDLATLYPDIIEEWDYEKNNPQKPSDTYPKSNKKYWWKCSLGHSWKAQVYSRTTGKGCPYCNSRMVLSGFNDLATTHPHLLSEWDYSKNTMLPTEIMANSHKPIHWIGSCGHAWEACPANRIRGTGCPYCSGNKVLQGFNDLKSQNPDLVEEWSYEKNSILPENVHYHSSKKVWWICKNNHTWQASVYSRVTGRNCPYCINKKPVVGINDFATVHPELMAEWNYDKNPDIQPELLTYQSRKKIWWVCAKGHEWKTEVYHRAKGRGCPVCARDISRRPVTEGTNDLITLRPDIAEEWDFERNQNLKPEQFSINSQRKVWWKCKKGHHWRCIIQGRTIGKGCPYCAGKRPDQSKIL